MPTHSKRVTVELVGRSHGTARWRELSLARAIFRSTMSCVTPLITTAVVGVPRTPNTRTQGMGTVHPHRAAYDLTNSPLSDRRHLADRPSQVRKAFPGAEEERPEHEIWRARVKCARYAARACRGISTASVPCSRAHTYDARQPIPRPSSSQACVTAPL